MILCIWKYRSGNWNNRWTD